MHFTDYQAAAESTAIYPSTQGLEYVVLGLTNEAGEVAGVLKKHIRDGNVSDQEFASKMRKELGDCLWYLSMCASELGMSLDVIAEENIDKLLDRKRRGVLSGSGDDR